MPIERTVNLMLLCCLLPLSPLLRGQEVSGRITGTDDAPLTGVTVRVKNTSTGTLTGVEGNYTVSVESPEDTLLFSYLGMVTRSVPVQGRSRIDVQLREQTTQLTAAVVTAYRGTQQARDLVGSYDQVSTEELVTDRPVESFDKLLEGRIAGVRVENITGEPGLPVRVQIRGQSSLPATGSNITASTQPLYVLDGVPLYDVLETNTRNTVFSDGNNQLLNPLAFINPDDIETITVLKDASATALYGADASNGVILITTKQGAAGKTRVNLSASYGTGRPIDEIKFLSTAQYLELARETLFNDGLDPALAGRSDVDTDWRELVLQNPSNADVDLSLSGGAGEMTYRLSAGYNALESVHKRNGIRQGNLNLNLRFPVGEKVSLSTRLSGAYQYKEGLRSFNGYTFPPNLPVRNADGRFNNAGTFEDRPNPAALLAQNENYQNSYNLNGQLTLDYQPLTALRLRVLAGLDQQSRGQFQYQSMNNASGARFGGRLIRADNRNLQWIANAQAIWTPQLGERHHLTALLGAEAQRQDQFRQVAQGKNFPFDDLRRLSVLPQEETQVAESTFERAKASTYGEVAYDYGYRYYLKLNARRDASSIFGGDRQAEIFWALGTGWNFSAEPALADRLPLGIDYGKLRASYGVTGNSRLGVYTTGGVYRQEFADENYGGALPALVELPANDLLSWERKRQTNLGLDLGWRADRFGLTVEYYSNRTVDGLFTFETPRESGFLNILANAASIRNWGYELTLRYATDADGKLRYSTSLNAARNRNRLLEISKEQLPDESVTVLIEGRDINLIYGIPFAGVNPETGTAEYYLPDGSVTDEREQIINPFNYVPIGNRAPDFFGGWHNQLTYGPVTLTLQINYSYGQDILVDRLTFTDGQQIGFNNQSINQLDRWQRPGDITDVPRLSIENGAVSRSSRYVFRANYLEFSTLNLSVQLGEFGFLPRSITGASVFANLNNLGYIYDEPRRKDRNGVREYRFTFPEQRTLNLGVKINW